jgi:hypothetical protein
MAVRDTSPGWLGPSPAARDGLSATDAEKKRSPSPGWVYWRDGKMTNRTAVGLWLVPIAVLLIEFGGEYLNGAVAPELRAPIRPTCDALCLAAVIGLVLWCARRGTPRAAFGYGFATGAAFMVAEVLGWAYGLNATAKAVGAEPIPVSDLGSALYLWLPIFAIGLGATVGGAMGGIVWLMQSRRARATVTHHRS